MHHGTCVTHVPLCMPGSLTSDFLWYWWRGKHSRHSRRMRNPQFDVSGKRPMASQIRQPGYFFIILLGYNNEKSKLIKVITTWIPLKKGSSVEIFFLCHDIILIFNGLVQERRNSSALAMELRLSCANPLISQSMVFRKQILTDLNWHWNLSNYMYSKMLSDAKFLENCINWETPINSNEYFIFIINRKFNLTTKIILFQP